MTELGAYKPLSIAYPPELPTRPLGQATLKVLGLGGGGSNAINRMIELGVAGVDFIAANTDRQALASSLAPVRLQLGPRITRGLGAGGNPKTGAAAAMESSREIAAALAGADMVFITAGMGGGTGTGSAAIAAEIAHEIGAVVVAVVTMPFSFEMTRRSQNALEGIRSLQPHTHTLITVPNDKLLQVVPRDLSLEIAFRLADDVLRQGVQGIAELITRPGMINVDFANIRELMLRGGGAYMAIGLGKGEEKANAAIEQALHHPLLEMDSLDTASGVLVHFTGGEDLTLFEIGDSVTRLRQKLSPDTDVILGATTEKSMNGRAQVILIFTGVGGRPMHASTGGDTEAVVEPIAVPVAQSQADLDLPTFLRRRVAAGAGR
ncbi:MAG: cell division protein FtsZ [Anaerolineales bacterium]|nr:MAG: cell division protein FtsZ [Anaerolineales bacterium]